MFINSFKTTCCRWALKNYINSNKIDIIIILTTNLKFKIKYYVNSSKIDAIIILTSNLKFEIFINKNNFISIRHYQIAEINDLDKNNIDNAGQNTMTFW